MLPRLAVALSLITALLAQAEAEILVPKDLAALHAHVAAMPVQPSVAGGVVVRVVDGETGEPIAGADVLFVADPKAVDPATANAMQQQLRESLESPRLTMAIWCAVLGKRYRTDEQGRVVLPATVGPAGVAVAVAGERVGSRFGEAGELVVHRPRFVDVLVLRADGKPARGVPVGFGELGSRGYGTSGATDADGRCRIEIDMANRRGPYQVRAMIASSEPVVADVDLQQRVTPPVELRLPPCGQVRFILYGADGRPVDVLRSATLKIERNRSRRSLRGPRSVAVRPTSSATGSATFGWVELGQAVAISASIEDGHSALSFAGKGPTRPRELVIIEGRLEAPPSVLAFRVIDQQGQPVISESVGVLLRGDRGYSSQVEETDAAGRVRLPVDRTMTGHLYVLRRLGGEAAGRRSAGRVPLPEIAPGEQDLGDLRLREEPVAVRGRLVGPNGEPVAGAWVVGNGSIASGNGGGSGSMELFGHRVQTDAAGEFELREFEPVDVDIRLRIEGRDWVVPGPMQVRPGPDLQTITAYPMSTITARLAGDDLEGLEVDVSLVHRETGQELRCSMQNGALQPVHWAAGSYDVKIGGRMGFTIENVMAPAGGEVDDPRLHPVDLTGRARVVRVQVNDSKGEPVAEAMVWNLVVRKDGGGGGGGGRTDAAGRVVLLVAEPQGDIAGAELKVEKEGCETKVITEIPADLRVTLARIAPIVCRVEGLPEVPSELQVSIGFAPKPRRGVLPVHFGGRGPEREGDKVTVHADRLGTWQLQVSLGIGYARTLSPELRRDLQRELPRKPIMFDVEVTGEAGEPRVFKLTDEQRQQWADCLESVRAILADYDKR